MPRHHVNAWIWTAGSNPILVSKLQDLHLTLVGNLFGRVRVRFPVVQVVTVDSNLSPDQKSQKGPDLLNPGDFGGHLCGLHAHMQKSAHLSQTLTNQLFPRNPEPQLTD